MLVAYRFIDIRSSELIETFFYKSNSTGVKEFIGSANPLQSAYTDLFCIHLIRSTPILETHTTEKKETSNKVPIKVN